MQEAPNPLILAPVKELTYLFLISWIPVIIKVVSRTFARSTDKNLNGIKLFSGSSIK